MEPNIKHLVSIGLLLSTSLFGCSSIPPQSNQSCDTSQDCLKFTILHTNDNHGRFWHNKQGEYGMAARKTLIDRIRREVTDNKGYSLLLSGGDINTGVPESDLQDAEPDFIGMSHLGYDAMAVGNHEFDNELAVVEQQRSWSNFPWLAANIYKNENGKQVRYFEPYKIFNFNGVRIAVIGLITEDTATIGNPQIVHPLTFTDPKQEVKQVITEINAANKADIIFAVTHMGHYEHGNHGSNAPGDTALANSLTPGLLQAIFGGHSQNPVCMEPNSDNYAAFKPGDDCQPDRQNGTYIMQAHEWGKYLGRADFEYIKGQLKLVNYQLIPVNLKQKNAQGELTIIDNEIPADETTYQILKPYQNKGGDKLNQIIATTEVQLTRDNEQQTQLGHLIATAQSRKYQADFGIMNSGGIRAPIAAGQISYRDVLTVQPFGNTVTVSEKTGKEIAKYLGKVASKQIGSGGHAQINNVSMIVDCQAQTVNISTINGQAFNPSKLYRFTVPSYGAAGGDAYPKLTGFIDNGDTDAEVLYDFLKAKKTIKATDYQAVKDQIQYINSASPHGCMLTNIQ